MQIFISASLVASRFPICTSNEHHNDGGKPGTCLSGKNLYSRWETYAAVAPNISFTLADVKNLKNIAAKAVIPTAAPILFTVFGM